MSKAKLSSSSEKRSMDPPPHYTEAAGPSTIARTTTFQTTFACISLNMTDKIRFIQFPPDHIQQVEAVIRSGMWTKGVQDTRKYGVAHEIKLRGNPWSGISWDSQKRAARNLVSGLFAELYAMGWVLKASVDLCKKQRDKDSLLFRFQQPPPPPCDWLNISFLRSDKLYIVNAPAELSYAILKALGAMVQRQSNTDGDLEITLKGSPWVPTGEETVTTRVIALILLEVLEQHGYSLYASIDQDNGPEGRGTDTWHCCRVKRWQAGQPVFHS